MSCEAMQEWEEIEEEIEELKEEVPEITATKEEIKEEIHQESHRLQDFEKRMVGKPNLKRSEMKPVLLRAAETVIARHRAPVRQPVGRLLPSPRKFQHSG